MGSELSFGTAIFLTVKQDNHYSPQLRHVYTHFLQVVQKVHDLSFLKSALDLSPMSDKHISCLAKSEITFVNTCTFYQYLLHAFLLYLSVPPTQAVSIFSASLSAMASSQTILLSCLFLMAPGLGHQRGNTMVEMREEVMEEMKEEMVEIRKEMSVVLREEISVELRKEMREELHMNMEEKVGKLMKEMDVIKQEKSEMEERVAEVTKKLEAHELKVNEMEAKSTKDQPFVMACAYTAFWSTSSSTISFDRLSADYNNADRPGSDGRMDLATGIFTALTAGHYTVTYSGHAFLSPGEAVEFLLYRNGQDMGREGAWYASSDSNDAGPTRDQGTKSLVSV